MVSKTNAKSAKKTKDGMTLHTSVIWQTVSVTVTLSIAAISASDIFMFTPMSHHAVLQSETSVTHVALKRSLT